MAYTVLQYGEKMQNIKKSNLQRAHTQAQQNAPEQTRPRVSNSHKMCKRKLSNCISHSHK